MVRDAYFEARSNELTEAERRAFGIERLSYALTFSRVFPQVFSYPEVAQLFNRGDVEAIEQAVTIAEQFWIDVGNESSRLQVQSAHN